MRANIRAAILALMLVLALAVPSFRNSASAQPAKSRARYGAFPISGARFAVLKQDLALDRRQLKANRARCKALSARMKIPACDLDGDGISTQFEKRLGTNPRSVDTDGEGLRDRLELLKYRTDPTRADTDGDGFSDAEEILFLHTDPLRPAQSTPGPSCGTPNFDTNGDTRAFGIPAPNVGNLGRGQQSYGQSCGVCHKGAEKGTNYPFPDLKTRIGQPPMNLKIADSIIADLVAFLNRTQTGGSGDCATPTPAPTEAPGSTPTPTPTQLPTGPGCQGEIFDAYGNTVQLGIPTPLVGNISRGAAIFAASCSTCHGDRGAGMSFPQIKAAVTGPLMNITTVSDLSLADLTAYANRALAVCPGTPTPVPQPTVAPTVTPTATPYTSNCSNQYFDGGGNSTQFGIPSPLIGNITRGSSYYGLSCGVCHGERGTNFTFSQLKTAVTGPLMRINSVTDQQYADLAAYVNRSLAPQSCGTPVPTPTPLDDISAGRIAYQAICQTCHSRPSELRETTAGKLRHALADEDEMQGLTLTDAQIRVIVAYLNSLPSR